MTRVIIAGGGPTGLMLAYELRLAGIEVRVVDKLPRRSPDGRAGGMHARTLEVLDQRGIVEEFLAEGMKARRGHFAGLWLDFSGFAARHNYMLLLVQSKMERILERHVNAAGAEVEWASEVVGVEQDGAGVAVEIKRPNGTEIARADYLVAADGGRGGVRRLLGVDFPGTGPTVSALIADVKLTDPPEQPVFFERRDNGAYSVMPFFEDGMYRIFTSQHGTQVDRATPATFDELRETFAAIAGTDFGMHSPTWVSRFSDTARLVERYRHGRVLFAGDAAHIHYPAGGQGLNTGVQDAVNLGWKLASVLNGHHDDALLDSYHSERHPVAERVLNNTRAQTALDRPGPHTDALREIFADLIDIGEVNARLGGMISALDVRYPMGEGHPLLGRRVPDADLDDGTRVFTHLHAGRPVLLDLGGLGIDAGARVDVVRAGPVQKRWDVPGLGEIDAPSALLIRPDGHVAWAGEAADDALGRAVAAWC